MSAESDELRFEWDQHLRLCRLGDGIVGKLKIKMPNVYLQHMPNMALKSVMVSQAMAYRFVFEEVGWAILTLNDSTGELSIQSDWGDWAYRWDIRAIGAGKTLTQFVSDRGMVDYLCDKLHYGKERGEFSPEASKAAVIEAIKNAKKEGVLKPKAAAAWLRELGRWDPPNNIDDFLGGVPSVLDDPHQFIVTRATFSYTFLREKLLPMFIDHLITQSPMFIDRPAGGDPCL